MKSVVIGGQQERRLAFEQNESFRRITDEDRSKVEPIMHTTAKNLTMWRTFRIGGLGKRALLAKIKAGYEVVSKAQDIITLPAFMTVDKEQEIDTIVLTPADFGAMYPPPTMEFLEPRLLSRWSMENARRLFGYAVGLLPAESGPHVLHQYKNQPRGEILRIAMARITDSLGVQRVFCLERSDNSRQWLRADIADPDYEWGLDSKFLFGLYREQRVFAL